MNREEWQSGVLVDITSDLLDLSIQTHCALAMGAIMWLRVEFVRAHTLPGVRPFDPKQLRRWCRLTAAEWKRLAPSIIVAFQYHVRTNSLCWPPAMAAHLAQLRRSHAISSRVRPRLEFVDPYRAYAGAIDLANVPDRDLVSLLARGGVRE